MNSIFHNKSFPIKANPTIIRTEKIQGPSKRVPVPPSKEFDSKSKSYKYDTIPSIVQDSLNESQKRQLSDSRKSSSIRPIRAPTSRNSKLIHKRPYTQDKPHDSDTSDPENSVTSEVKCYKRQKLTRLVDSKRKICLEDAFSEKVFNDPELIHAASIISTTKRSKKAIDCFDTITFDFKYPSNSGAERYALAFGNDFDSAAEIIDVVKIVLNFYLQEDQGISLKDPEKGIVRKLTKAYNLFAKNFLNIEALHEFKNTINIYNSVVDKYISDNTFSRNLNLIHNVPLNLVECILQQVYVRAVSPKVDILKRYENGTDNVYGELLPPLVSRVLWEAGLTSDAIFVDLGSGVGNVVLQAALEFGCESWGCEMMDNAATLAEAQKKEFGMRCRLWSLKTGTVCLEHGDFLNNPKIYAIIQKADVILVNNQAFTPDLNQRLKDLFLDSKDGCKIISLKSFVSHGHQISIRNLWDPINLFHETEGKYHRGSVSWTDTSGKYYIATKDENRLSGFTAQSW